MCFGGGKSADDYYNEMKPTFGPLPSLRTDKSAPERKDALKDLTMRKGKIQRSLLNPYGDTNA